MSASVFFYLSVSLALLIPIGLTVRAEGGFKIQSKKVLGFITVWLVVTYVAAAQGVFRDFSTNPPRFFILLPTILVVALLLARSAHGTLISSKFSVYSLIGIQTFRFLPEFFLDLSYREGFAPIQMTYHGRNLDIFVAIAALLIFILNDRIPVAPKKLAILFSVFGLGLLFNIIAVAMLSTPVSFRYFMKFWGIL